MIISFTAINKQLLIKSFAFKTEKLEDGLDFVSFVSSKGDVMLSIQLIDEYGTIDIPLEAFTEEPFSKPIQRLEKQWKKLLEPNRPVPSKHTKELIKLTRKQLRNHERLLANLDSTIDKLKVLLHRANRKTKDQVSSISVVNHYTALIQNYEQQIGRVRDTQKVALTKLSKLQQ